MYHQLGFLKFSLIYFPTYNCFLKKIESCAVKGLAMFAKRSMGYNIIKNYVLESLMKAHCTMLNIINTFTFWIFKK